MKYLLPLIALGLAGCAAPAREAPYTKEAVTAEKAGGFVCEATWVQQDTIGKKASVALAQQLMEKTGSDVLRWIPPRAAVTMDYNPVRLNISYDDNMVITQISCG
jgi:Peptidase inhibitor I78 family